MASQDHYGPLVGFSSSPLTQSSGGFLSSLSGTGKSIRRREDTYRDLAHQDLMDTKRNMFNQELRTQEFGQVLRNTNQVIDTAFQLAGTDQVKQSIFGDMIAQCWIPTETMIYNLHHNPLLGGR